MTIRSWGRSSAGLGNLSQSGASERAHVMFLRVAELRVVWVFARKVRRLLVSCGIDVGDTSSARAQRDLGRSHFASN